MILQVHQTLHGYSNGHRLLEASVKLSVEAQRTMLAMSDLSGTSQISGFETYITSYPLTGTPYYAFARTWLAPELPRPGCVWTHSLLLDFQLLRELNDMRSLLSLLRRPTADSTDWRSYGVPIRASLVDPEIGLTAEISPALSILKTLYESPDSAAWLSAPTARQYEDLLVAIWSQQWPDLRKRFSYCSGALSPRFLDGRALDLQVAPDHEIARWPRLVSNERRIIAERSLDVDSWLSLAAHDLLELGDHGVRDFLRSCGDESIDGRRSFVPLLTTYAELERVRTGNEPLSALTETIAKAFPLPTEGSALKKSLYGKHRGDGRSHLLVDESELLNELGTTPYGGAFDAAVLDIGNRVLDLWDNDRPAGIYLLEHAVASEGSPLRHVVMTAAAESAKPTDLALAARQENGILLGTLLKLRPSLAASAELWSVAAGAQQFLIGAILAADPEPEELRPIIGGAVVSGRDGLASLFMQWLGDRALAALLDWVDKDANEGDSLPSEWLSELSNRTTFVVDWLQRHRPERPEVLGLSATVLDPEDSRVKQLGASMWMPLAKGLAERDDQSLAKHVFLLALGLQNVGFGADELAVGSFETVHGAAASGTLLPSSWQTLERFLPSAGFGKDWDRCERLRRGLIFAFVEHGWRPELILRAAGNEDTFRRLIDTASSTRPGKRFLSRLEKLYLSGQLSLSTPQADLLAVKRGARNSKRVERHVAVDDPRTD